MNDNLTHRRTQRYIHVSVEMSLAEFGSAEYDRLEEIGFTPQGYV